MAYASPTRSFLNDEDWLAQQRAVAAAAGQRQSMLGVPAATALPDGKTPTPVQQRVLDLARDSNAATSPTAAARAILAGVDPAQTMFGAAAKSTAPPPQSTAPPQPAAPATPTFTLSPRAQALLDQIDAFMKRPTLTAQDAINSPEYTSQQQAIDFQRQQAQSALRRSLASRNMLYGTPAVQALAGSDAEYTARENALVPQLIATAYNRQQQQLQNLRSQFNDQLGAEQQAFNQGIAAAGQTGTYNGQPTLASQAQTFHQGVTEAGFTGTYKGQPTLGGRAQDRADATQTAGYTGIYAPPGAREAANEVVVAKDEYNRLKRQGLPDNDPRLQQATARAASARAALLGMGITNVDELLGPNVAAEEARANIGRVGIVTPEARKAEIERTGIDPVTGKPTLSGQRTEAQIAKTEADTELVKLRGEAEKLKNAIATDPDIGTRAEKQTRLRQINAQIANLVARTDKTNQPAAPRAPKVSAQRNEFRGLVTAAKTQGRTYEEAVQAVRDNAGDLGDVSLQDALDDVAAIYGMQKQPAGAARTEALNGFAADVAEKQGGGWSYETAVAETVKRAGQLKGVTLGQALDVIDRIYQKGHYAPRTYPFANP